MQFYPGVDRCAVASLLSTEAHDLLGRADRAFMMVVVVPRAQGAWVTLFLTSLALAICRPTPCDTNLMQNTVVVGLAFTIVSTRPRGDAVLPRAAASSF